MYSSLLNLVMPGLLSATKSRYVHLARLIHKRQYWSASELQSWQDTQVQELVTFALTEVAYYRQLASQLGISPRDIRSTEELACLPPLTKSTIQQHFPDGMTPTKKRDEDCRVIGTRGTTNRLMVLHDFSRRDHARATGLHVLTADCPYQFGDRRVSIPPDACSIVCGLEGMRDSTVLRHLVTMVRKGKLRDPEAVSDLRGLVMSNWIECETILQPFGPDGTNIEDARLASYLGRIQEVRPTLLWALPQYLQALAGYIDRVGCQPPPLKLVRPMGANLDRVTKERIERSFDVPVREHYGSLELGGMAFDCHAQTGLHLLADQYVFEVVMHGQRVPDGELGTLLVTDLNNYAMPLIRYQIGDMARIVREPCVCGRTTPRIFLEGRLEDTIVTDDGRMVTPERLACCLYENSSLDQFQFLENERGSFELRYVEKAGQSVRPSDLADAIKPLFDSDQKVVFRRVRTILPESSGKFRHVKSRSFTRLLQSHSTCFH